MDVFLFETNEAEPRPTGQSSTELAREKDETINNARSLHHVSF